MENFTPTHYTLECVATGRQFEDEGWMLDDPCCKIPSMIRTRYAVRQIDVRPDSYGFYKFCDWLPVRRMLQGSSAPVTYKSKGLADYLGLKNLYITFNGYYPEIGAKMTTCSFKETEAYSVCARIREGDNRILVVASAGNTARAFAKVCSDNNIPLLLSVPEENISALWFDRPLNPCVKLICPERGGDYFDAISDGTNITRSKPDPQVFLMAADFIGMKPEKCLVVEDAKAGIQAAVAGGFDSAGLGEAAACGMATYAMKTFGDLKGICG